MPKNIVLLSDGTGNSAAKLQKTNVWRMYEALKLTAPAEQVACYDDGVGTSTFGPLALLGGVFGIGLKRNVLRLYRFLCEHYDPGDRIYVFGFSRGAFTVRVLAGLIADQGIIKTRSDAPEGVYGSELARLAQWAYRGYRQRLKGTFLVRAARALRDRVLRGLQGRRPGYDPANNHQVDTIEFVGVWDTVDAYGLPIDELTAGIDKFVWPLSMSDQSLSGKVRKACHAVALDDERNTFHPVLWDEAKETTSLTATGIEEERISQVWFAGVHSNVGGGYADDALSYVSFKWMADQARLRGLLFSEGLLAYHIAKADVLGRIYDSRRGLAGYYRYNPRKIEWLTNGQVHEQRLFGNRWPKPSPSVTVPRPKIHQSVLERIKAAPEAYAPIGFPTRYAVVTEDGRILDGPEHPLETEAVSHARVLAQEAVWDLVWWRRLAYFSAVAVTLVVLARPLRDGAAAAAQSVEPDAAGRAVAALGGLLPDLASLWVKYYTAYPRELAIGLFLLLALMALGRRLQSRICGKMRGLWLRVVANDSEVFEAPRSLLFRIRSHALYQGAFAVLRRKLLPALTGIGALLFLVVLAGRAPFHIADAAGSVCDAGPSAARGQIGSPLPFDSQDLCTATGVQSKKGKRYQISLELPGKGQEAWKDSEIPVSSPAGFTSGSPELSLFQRAIFTLASPFRRVVNADWFVPVARIGRSGPYFQLTASPAQFTAPASGELFLFVNDAILPPWRFFYDNNHGTARVIVTEVSEEPVS
jgi:uncharacterized protein (DUF2235 family)